MADKAGDVAALGGSRPSETGPGTGGAVPTGGGKAVPDDQFLMGETGSSGDSLDDGALIGGLNSGTSVDEEAGAAAGPRIAPTDEPASAGDGGAPTGRLSSSGTTGSAPTGALLPGAGDKSA